MEFTKFIYSWAALWLWGRALERELVGARLAQAFTYRKGQLDLHFFKGDTSLLLTWSVAGKQAKLNLSLAPGIPRKKVVLLKGFPGDLQISSVAIHAADRILKLDFGAHEQLILGFYPAILNVFHLRREQVVETFFKDPAHPEYAEHWLASFTRPPLSPPGGISADVLNSAAEGIRLLGQDQLVFGPAGAGAAIEITRLERELSQRPPKPAGDSSTATLKQARTVLKRWSGKLGKMEAEYALAENWAEDAQRLEGLRIAQGLQLPIQNGRFVIPGEMTTTGKPWLVELSQDESLQQAIETTARQIRKAKAKLELLLPQIKQVRDEIEHLERQTADGSLEELQNFLNRHGAMLDKRGRQSSERTPYKKYLSPSGYEILVGRGSRDNDTLTFKIAHKNDYWFHTRQIRGSHVILRSGNREPTLQDIRKAAEYAALNSKAKHAGIVVVQYCQRKHLAKPKGSPPGSVLVHQERSITIDLDLI